MSGRIEPPNTGLKNRNGSRFLVCSLSQAGTAGRGPCLRHSRTGRPAAAPARQKPYLATAAPSPRRGLRDAAPRRLTSCAWVDSKSRDHPSARWAAAPQPAGFRTCRDKASRAASSNATPAMSNARWATALIEQMKNMPLIMACHEGDKTGGSSSSRMSTRTCDDTGCFRTRRSRSATRPRAARANGDRPIASLRRRPKR